METRNVVALFLGILFFSIFTKAATSPTVQWFGHACFSITSSAGTTLVIDPFAKLNYPPPAIQADIAVVTHDHFDHNNIDVLQGAPTIVKAIQEEGKKFNNIDVNIKGFHIVGIKAFHDSKQGAERGLDTIFIIEVDGIRFVHMGDLGEIPPAETVAKLGRVDVLFIPVGGHYTIGPDEARKVVDLIKPAVVVPMHYKTDKVDLPLKTVDDFISPKTDNVKKLKTNKVSVTLPAKREVWVFPVP